MADLINWASEHQEEAEYEAQQEAGRQAEQREEAERHDRSVYGLGRRLQEWITPEVPNLGRHLNLDEVSRIASGLTDNLDEAVMKHYQECHECSQLVRRAEDRH